MLVLLLLLTYSPLVTTRVRAAAFRSRELMSKKKETDRLLVYQTIIMFLKRFVAMKIAVFLFSFLLPLKKLCALRHVLHGFFLPVGCLLA